ncbi:unnamed protein product [Staurois parvus]|uniref:Uncharacterized protein n=1 Tax=Staurois parvus TaxID=386267 RepID=A0ABN9BSM2_9NEOB|nr:unnamed protein product [Staurois parvus]
MSLESWVGAVLRPDSTARVLLSPQDPCPGVGCPRLQSAVQGDIACLLPETPAQG